MERIDEQFRAECEARYWLSKGYSTPGKIEQLQSMISKKRGQKAAQNLIDNMRKEWRKGASNAKK